MNEVTNTEKQDSIEVEGLKGYTCVRKREYNHHKNCYEITLEWMRGKENE